jgi:hypothetical protein
LRERDMVERRIQGEYEDHRYGFPVILRQVPMIKVRGEWVPELNANHLRWAVLLALAHKPGPLTGSEVRFLRHWMELTAVAFGESVGVSHAAVLKWEKAGDGAAKIAPGTEFRLRFLILEKLPPEVRYAIVGLDETTSSSQVMARIIERMERIWECGTMAAPAGAPVEVPAELLAQQYLPLLRDQP